LSDAEKTEAVRKRPLPLATLPRLEIPLAMLTPSQQKIAREYAAYWNHEAAANPEGDQERLTLDGNMLLESHADLLLTVPSLSDPISLETYCSPGGAYAPSRALRDEYANAHPAQPAPRPEAPRKSMSLWTP
jgi:hypothetical protein